MAIYVLDSDILDFLDDQSCDQYAACMNKLSQLSENDEVCVSILTIYELDYSIAAAANPSLALGVTNHKEEILNDFLLLSLTLGGSQIYGDLKAKYKLHSQAKSKRMKGHTVDMILAATALDHDAILVSNDHLFSILQSIEPKLKVENWAVAQG